jgi:uncharacterized lipoprotein YmbA
MKRAAMMNRVTRLVQVVSIAIVLGACGSSPPVRYYDLEALETGYAPDKVGSSTVGVGPLRAPDYLSRPRMVTRAADATIVVNDFDRWVERLDEAIHRVLATNLDAQLDDAVVVAFPYTHISDLDYRVVGRIDRFDADADGLAVLEIQWGVIGRNDEILVQPRRARYEARSSREPKYAGIAYAMSEVVQQLSRDVAARLEALVDKS